MPESTVTVPPPVEEPVVLYNNVRPDGSVNDTDPATAPVAASAGLAEAGVPATGVPTTVTTPS